MSEPGRKSTMDIGYMILGETGADTYAQSSGRGSLSDSQASAPSSSSFRPYQSLFYALPNYTSAQGRQHSHSRHSGSMS